MDTLSVKSLLARLIHKHRLLPHRFNENSYYVLYVAAAAIHIHKRTCRLYSGEGEQGCKRALHQKIPQKASEQRTS